MALQLLYKGALDYVSLQKSLFVLFEGDIKLSYSLVGEDDLS